MQQRAIASESEMLMREFRQSFESLTEYSNNLLKSFAVNESSSMGTVPRLSTPLGAVNYGNDKDGDNRLEHLSSFAGNMNASSSSSSSSVIFNLTSSTSQISPLDVSVILEKYSDKLVELIADKMAAAGNQGKLNK